MQINETASGDSRTLTASALLEHLMCSSSFVISAIRSSICNLCTCHKKGTTYNKLKTLALTVLFVPNLLSLFLPHFSHEEHLHLAHLEKIDFLNSLDLYWRLSDSDVKGCKSGDSEHDFLLPFLGIRSKQGYVVQIRGSEKTICFTFVSHNVSIKWF